MIRIGCLARFNNPYDYEVKFAKENSFAIMQVWYDKYGIRKHETEESRFDKILNYDSPTIIHALLDINEIETHIPKLIQLLKTLNHKELIIHPICHSEEINYNTIQKLSDIIGRALIELKKEEITLFLENNSKLDPIFSTPKEISLMFAQNPELEFLIDIAHIFNYEHLKAMLSIKKPKKLHITDSHFDVIHEHVPLGQGDIDFKYIFSELLPDFCGDLIIELSTNDNDIIHAKKVLECCLAHNH